MKDDPTCPLCQGRQTTEHVLSSCKVALSQGRYTWRHNRVLQEFASAINTAEGEIHPSSTSSALFTTKDVLRHPSSDKRQKINFALASSGKQWEDMDNKIVLKIDSLLGKSNLEHKLATFGDIVYQTYLDTSGAKQHQTKCPPREAGGI
ncbi:reverse transcriptase [Plakobranchus ocellatus]|uniref:Reverse transcriptase n=1 Tax=Plakobranchus ocellatus TaxID=259542 RepID=A0AAV3YTR9_9GAST|nr:reverse transcriptase [Plakobranchus ocellatus]